MYPVGTCNTCTIVPILAMNFCSARTVRCPIARLLLVMKMEMTQMAPQTPCLSHCKTTFLSCNSYRVAREMMADIIRVRASFFEATDNPAISPAWQYIAWSL